MNDPKKERYDKAIKILNTLSISHPHFAGSLACVLEALAEYRGFYKGMINYKDSKVK